MIAKSSSEMLPGDFRRAGQKLEEHISQATEILSASIIQASGIFKACPRTLASPMYSRTSVDVHEHEGSWREWARRLGPTLMIMAWFVAVSAIIAVTAPASGGPSTAGKSGTRLPSVSVHPPGVHSAEDLASLERPGSL